jgi:G3E family GTPase
MQRFDYIVIEASGICEPGPIAQTICSIPSMDPEITKDGYPCLDCIVTVVDALRMRDEFEGGALLTRPDIDEEDIENLVIQQIEFCNIVLLNKAAEVTPDELGRIRSIVRTLQPKAEIIECNYGDVDFDKILNTNMFDFDKVATSAAWIQEVERHHEERYRKLLKNIEDNVVFSREGDAIWQCRNCGHIVVGKQAPEVCPVCDHPQSYFQLKPENY